jgi:hypothetical protein
MEIAQRSRLVTSGRNHDTAILLGYSVLASVFLIALYLASMSAGTAPGDFATMTVFP